jgi:hypothetical protein
MTPKLRAYWLLVGWTALTLALFLVLVAMLLCSMLLVIFCFIWGNGWFFLLGVLLFLAIAPVLAASQPTVKQLQDAMVNWNEMK